MTISIELSAVYHVDDSNIDTCNDRPEQADAFAVYLKNPTAFHLKDFAILDFHEKNISSTIEGCRFKAFDAALAWSTALAEHLGCPLNVISGKCSVYLTGR